MGSEMDGRDELAKELRDANPFKQKNVSWEKQDKSSYYRTADILLAAGYRKVPADAVVVSWDDVRLAVEYLARSKKAIPLPEDDLTRHDLVARLRAALAATPGGESE